ncbi:hypothetical protein ACA910_015917 [Epithemia clementina (nom. ined.)]
MSETKKEELPPIIYPRERFPTLDVDITVEGAYLLMRWSDAGIWAGGTVGCWIYGFIKGYPARFATAGLMGTVGFTWGSFIVLQNVRARVLGYAENGREAEWYRKRREEAAAKAAAAAAKLSQ